MIFRTLSNQVIPKKNNAGFLLFSTCKTVRNAAKSPLAKLRKASGYPLSLCKKALTENNDNVDDALTWLQNQAQAEGWAKAQSLGGRQTTAGLLGVQVDGAKAVMVEISCETDFVARNTNFLSLLQEVTALNIQAAKDWDSGEVKHLNKEELENIPQRDGGKLLADLVALNIGVIGENILLKKSAWMALAKHEHSHLIGYTHPSGDLHSDKMSYGKYGVLMAVTKDPNVGELPKDQSIESMGRQLCQHVIGMNPESIGNLIDPSTWPVEKSPEVVPTTATSDEVKPPQEDEPENPDGDYDTIKGDVLIDTSQTEMIHQPFLMNSDKLVREVLLETGMNIQGFVRYEVGQN